MKKTFIVLNEKGLHTRPSTMLAKCASKFESDIHLTYRGFTVNAKSILAILMLAVETRKEVLIEAEGADAEVAIEAIIDLSKKNFDVVY